MPSTNASSIRAPSSDHIDVSFQSIQSIQGNWTLLSPITPMTLNLSHNALPSIGSGGILRLPSSITTLDLSYNMLETLDSVDWGHFANLSTLILKGNQIRSMKAPLFPRSLVQLDLSDNPLVDVELSRDTYLQLTNVTVLMRTTRQVGDGTFPKRICPGSDLRFLGSNCVCVVAPPSTPHPVVEWLSKYGVLVLGATIVVFFAVKRGNDIAPAHLVRDTFMESSCDESTTFHFVGMSAVTDFADNRTSSQPSHSLQYVAAP
ncbi:hypothetical protein H310_07873 [Aphanomyces invadans]|uniref:Leucine-rich repeat-containing N-terminal plant-type domain-containing protein n=1 Tax=Aphanomyces invadans TaxID=157072 RepID=A0A024U1S1_9STRA|nr:hypothetical protein H310_07873 [Aphanomyces invadans]ETV99831.1 hypothetical protein H310_07873 [Aphanomyces invadans]|eukprot:XP_008871607.1 hypothetical protein H310_07873 [Aphanomyces invadans]